MHFNKLEKKKVFIVGIGLIVISLCLGHLYQKYKPTILQKRVINLINISEVSEKFMDNYFKEYSKLTTEDKDNMLIVISKKKITEGYGATKIIEGPNNNYYLVYPNMASKKNAIDELKKESSVLTVSENHKSEFFDNDNNESLYNSWGIKATGLDNASKMVGEIEANDVTVAILDTGCDMELFNKYYSGKIEETHNAIDEDDTMYDNFGHGTHIAGTIAEGTPDNVKIIPVKISDGAWLYETDIVNGINWVVYYDKADVINMSFGGYEFEFEDTFTAEYQAIESGKQKNIISVAAAGNDSMSEGSYPAAFDNTISISSVDANLELSAFSNYGSTITFAAPGGGIKSILSSNAILANGEDGDDEHEIMGGTSMATPHAVAAVAILKSFDKDLTLDNTIKLLKDHAVDLGEKGFDEYYGYGLINFNGVVTCTDNIKSCDEFNMFKILKPSAMTISEPTFTNYNYGSINNLLDTTVSFTEQDDYDYEKKLWELDDITITGYDPYSSEKQNVTIKYLDLETTFEVQNPDNYESGWEYQLIGDKYYISGYKDNNMGVNIIYFPETIDGFVMSGVGFKDEDSNYTSFSSYEDFKYYEKIVFPENIVSINDYAFKGVEGVRTIISEADDITVGTESFSWMPNLTTIDGNIVFLENSYSNFHGDKNLKDITISENTSSVIPAYAFELCDSLSEIELPDVITEIKDGAFYFSKSLSNVTLPKNLEIIGSDAFDGDNISSIEIPKSVNSIGSMAFAGNPLESIVVDKDNPYYDSRDNSNYIIETATNKIIQGSLNTNIPDSVLAIGAYSFYGFDIQELDIPEGVTTIENNAFAWCTSLKKLVVPNSVTNIGELAFDNPGIKSLDIVLWVHKDSYAHTYAIDNKNTYVIIEDSSNVTDIEDPYIELGRHTFYPGDDLRKYIRVVYYQKDSDGNYYETEIEDYDIIYQNGDSLQEGDTQFSVMFSLENSYQQIKIVSIMISVITPNSDIELPTVEKLVGDYICNYELPNGDGVNLESCIVFREPGDYTLIGSYMDITTWESYPNVELHVHVIDKKAVYECADIYFNDIPNVKFDDGNTSIDFDIVQLCQDDIDKSQYEIISASLEPTDMEEYAIATIVIRLSDDLYEEYGFPGNNQEATMQTNVAIIKGYPKPTIKNSNHFVYDGTEHIVEFNNFNRKAMYIYNNNIDAPNYSSTISLTDAGVYDFSIALQRGPFLWDDGSDSVLNFEIIVDKAKSNVEYTANDKTVVYDGEEHGIDLELVSPSDAVIKYYDDNLDCVEENNNPCDYYTLDEMPTYTELGTYKIKYKIHSDDNHEDVIGENTLRITNSPIVNNSKDYSGIYDGEEHSITIDVDIDNYDIKYSLDNENYDLDEMPTFSDVGEHTVYYKISADDYEDLYGSNKVKIYGIKEFDSNIKLKDNNILVTKSNSFGNVASGITAYATSSLYTHYDSSNNEVEEDLLKTGDKIVVNVNGTVNYSYKIAVLGDVNGNGEIDIIDYIRIMKDIMGTSKLSGVYYEAADVNENNEIDIIDYIRIMKIIMEEE